MSAPDKRSELLDRRLYSHADVDRHLHLPPGTARRWLNGYRRGGTDYPPMLRDEPRIADEVTSGEFVETRLLAEYRHRGVSLQRLRPAVVRLREEFGQYPLAQARPFLDVEGRELVRRIQGEVDLPPELQLVVVRTGQGLISAPPIKRFVAAVDFDEVSAVRVRPQPDSLVMIDPERQSGRPVVRSVPTDVVLEQFNAGESLAEISRLWDLSVDEVEAALRFELAAVAA
ncbi:DUF433 domain-containing protein [Georgenia sp. TF02-10]|uniref:DUF433 domain-containing protein n=1 Tax=Georgenia sp. TF02-10 TaxID=2917725 RepID=UPI001FA7A600|nr:DUF433 domain-containing protein [Georgenia sp. TF02-10]UNX54871.1 DUF433 domain-containing protein [Georgenia sp. TF02-10]